MIGRHKIIFLCITIATLLHGQEDPVNTFVSEQMKTMTIEEKVGQLFMIRAHSDKGAEHIKSVENQIKEYKVGGLCFFQGTPQKQADLTNKYQKLSKTPLIIAQDAEWGLGMRLKNTISFPKQLTIGAISDNTLIYQMGEAVAAHLKRTGVHVNFAPVVDINNNSENPVIHNRSFGEDGFNVATKSYAYTKGMQDNGIIACMKHFPGHGDTNVDSHYDLPLIPHSRQRLDSIEMMPFRIMTQLGIKSVMTAHLAIPSLDDTPNLPSSLSRKVVTGILQDQLHFEGLIFTDGLEMEGVAKHFKPGEIELKAIEAGNDILLLPIDIKAAYNTLLEAIKTERLSVSVIDQKVRKILKAKYELGLTGKPYIKNTHRIKADINDSESINLKRKIYNNAITLVKDANQAVPITEANEEVGFLSLGSSKMPTFHHALKKLGFSNFYQISKSQNLTASQLQRLKNFKKVIISLHDTNIYSKKDFGITEKFFDLIYQLNSNSKVVLVNFGSPYALKYFEAVPAILQAYEEDPLMQEATAEALYGINTISGQLPVGINSNFPIKTGLKRSSLAKLGFSTPASLNISNDSLLVIDTIVSEMISKKASPGCQIMALRKGKIFYNKTFGYHTYDKNQKVKKGDLFDVASVTKILATTIALMKLYDEGKLNIHHPLKRYLPELDTTNKGDLIIEDVLSHVSGLAGWIPFYKETMDQEAKEPTRLAKYYNSTEKDSFNIKVADNLYLHENWRDSIYLYIYNNDLKETRDYRYSDLGFYLFEQIIERISGKPLDEYVYENFYEPLSLKNTLFNPLDKFPKSKILPTEQDDYFRMQDVRGYVHDMGAAMLGGVSGHAGLFSTAEELAILMQMLLNGGHYGGKQFFKPETVYRFTRRHHRSSRRGLGFDMKELNEDKTENMAIEASDKTFGHLGFTGISVFADPQYDFIYIFLSNRTYPTMENKLFSKNNYRPRIQAAFYRAMNDFKR